MSTTASTVGDVLRQWRQVRRFSQLDLAHASGVSSRHLSFVESGRSQPSREMLARLADALDVPLRARNALLLAGGYAPSYPERSFGDPALAPVRRAVDLLLAGHEPYPGLVVDRAWNLVTANAAAYRLLDGVSPQLLEPPVNVLRLCFHPDGIAPRLRNSGVLLPQLISRLDHEIATTADARLVQLRDEMVAYPAMAGRAGRPLPPPEIVLQFQLESPAGLLSFITTTTVFGTASDVTVDELTIESFFPADEATGRLLQQMAASSPGVQG